MIQRKKVKVTLGILLQIFRNIYSKKPILSNVYFDVEHVFNMGYILVNNECLVVPLVLILV